MTIQETTLIIGVSYPPTSIPIQKSEKDGNQGHLELNVGKLQDCLLLLRLVDQAELLQWLYNCTARQCSSLRRNFIECSINNPALSLLMKHLVIGQRLKTPKFSAFHLSSRCSLVSIGQHFVVTRVVHLQKFTETSLITESDQSEPNHQLLQLCTACTAWSESDQAVRAVHSCNSWFNYHKSV